MDDSLSQQRRRLRNDIAKLADQKILFETQISSISLQLSDLKRELTELQGVRDKEIALHALKKKESALEKTKKTKILMVLRV